MVFTKISIELCLKVITGMPEARLINHMLSMCMTMGYSKTDPISNKIPWINIIFQDTSMTT